MTAPDQTGMLSRWETLQSSVEDSQRVQAFERDISALKAELLQLAARVNTLQEFQDRAQLEARILKIKKELSDLKERKPQLLQVNHAVHRFLTDASSHLGGGGGNSPPHPASVLKDDVAELYRVWDDAYNRISNHLVDLQRLSTTWQQLEVTMSELQVDLDHDHNTLRLIDTSLKSGPVSAEVTAQVRDIANVLSEKQEHAKQEGTLKSQTVLVPDLSRVSNPGLQFLSTEGGSLSDSGISDSGSENDLNGREKRLTALRQLARSMAAALEPGCAALLKINQELDQTESQLRSLQKSCRDLIVNTAVCMESNSLPLRNIATSTHNGISRRRKSSTPLLKATSPDADPDDPDDKRSGRWSWRLFRASLPFHVALVALFCVAWLLEPTCCDAMNNLVFSLTPQLRFARRSVTIGPGREMILEIEGKTRFYNGLDVGHRFLPPIQVIRLFTNLTNRLGIKTAEFKRNAHAFAWRKSAKPFRKIHPQCTPDRDLNLDLPILGSLIQHEISALDHAANEEG
uniref:KASH domain-containing protein n=2 Tax=Timema TaxID=61471 RepID=A0A7R9JXX1_TIMGE|nr:unnamed protein product [Timema genevievae]